VLSLRLERIAEQACGDTWRNIRDDLKQIKLAQLSSPNGTVWQVTEPGSNGNRGKSPGTAAFFSCADSSPWTLYIMCCRHPPFPR
jgi:hypothetical protein